MYSDRLLEKYEKDPSTERHLKLIAEQADRCKEDCRRFPELPQE
jgi:hypothetical protein